MSWFILAIIALLFWSGSDLFSKMGSKPDDKYSHWKMVIFVGAVMGIHAIIEIIRGADFKLSYMITYLPASALYILSMIIGYVGLRYLVLSLSSPVCNSSGAIAAILCFFFLPDQEPLDALSIIGIVLICVAIFALSVIEKHYDTLERRAAGIQSGDKKYISSFVALAFPLLYCLLDALGTFADSMILETLNEDGANIAYELTFLLMAVFAFIYVVIVRREKISIPKEKPKLAAAVCETAGQLAYVYALAANAVAAAPVISAYCIVSLIWARIFLKEKLTPLQYSVICVAFVGIILLGVAEGLAEA